MQIITIAAAVTTARSETACSLRERAGVDIPLRMAKQPGDFRVAFDGEVPVP
jgi:hypothetical protein